jgi:uncharacterized iron-regulated membrane protein
MMRQIHRWISFPLIIFLLLVTVTGVVLQFQEMGELGEQKPSPPTVSAVPDDAALLALVQKATIAARTAKPGFPAQNITLDFSRGTQKARFGIAPRGGPSIDVDLKTGETMVEMAPKPNLHVLMIQLHTGKFFGPLGLIVIGVVSIVFLVLTVTGFLVYLDMWKRRRLAGKASLFWK